MIEPIQKNQEVWKMHKKSYQKTLILMFLIAVLWLPNILITKEARAGGPGKWKFTVQPNVWLPTMDMDMKFSTPSGTSGSPSVEIEPDDYLGNLEGGMLLTAEARKGKWSFTANFIYMKVSSSESEITSVDFISGPEPVNTTLNIGADVEMKNFISTFGGGYQVLNNHQIKLDVIAGLRYFWMETQLDWNLSGKVNGPRGETFAKNGSTKESGDIWNGIAGLKGTILLGKSNWFIPFYTDVGTGDSDLTWQVFTGLGYSFNDRIDAMLGYRHLEFDQDNDTGIQNLRLSGPALGINIRF
jgi:hypothetical protein